ncbi:hypothetical protein NM688_g8324 [Phlebia brevispora]|uniref:Uncharacterized protein n=1 Tax=Phlebia brevispora TaxID=194682 RepID=A0ACC1RSN3_9APHY|nr:hypothetical protein NM688_g8324 [Phlebia brevispora]
MRCSLARETPCVTYATSSLLKNTLFGGPTNFIGGLAVTFRTGASHALEPNAIVKPVTALHITIARPVPYRPIAPVVSVSTQMAVLRRLLLEAEDEETETGYWFKKAVGGTIPLIIDVGSADIMASLLQLKADIEDQRGGQIRMVFAGATEAHLLASELAKAKVGVILAPVRPFPGNWGHRRIYAGPPITNTSAVDVLLKAGVTVALGVQEAWEAANIRWEAGWAALDSNGSIDMRHRYELVTTNLEKLMGIDGWIGDDGELVVYEGGNAFNMSSKVIAVASPRRGLVELF